MEITKVTNEYSFTDHCWLFYWFICVCVCAHVQVPMKTRKKKVLDSLGLETQVTVSCPTWELGSKLQSSWRVRITHNGETFTPASHSMLTFLWFTVITDQLDPFFCSYIYQSSSVILSAVCFKNANLNIQTSSLEHLNDLQLLQGIMSSLHNVTHTAVYSLFPFCPHNIMSGCVLLSSTHYDHVDSFS